ncbi:protein of unknown function [Lutibacter oricola]|uniref:Uncharacterized protein n=1 Tax=Lutibacter oricola TaxID=762486 RepID=A0A1H2R1R5_9FLAO|nr:PL29 family lyase N-terminal domain-containing protein [Lutibacter oricola]SDW12619.1 protein of unknown function [Lutibacter oricola]
MKKILIIFISFCLLFFNSCNKKLEEEIDELRDEINLNRNLINKLSDNLFINFIENIENGYKIYFSDDSSITIKNGEIPVIFIGENGNWIINGEDSGNQAQGSIGESPDIIIGESGNWIINGEDSGVKALGEDGQDSTEIISISYSELMFSFYFNDGSIIEVPVDLNFKRIACWGDSLTAWNNYPIYLRELLGNNYEVINCGVGGENSITIGARQGGIPMYLKNSIELPETKEPINIGSLTDSGLYSIYNDKRVYPLLQGGFSTINNCTIDGVQCLLRWTGANHFDLNGRYTVERSSCGKKHKIPENSLIFTSSMNKYRNLYANIYFIGQNGGFLDAKDLVNQYKKMVEFSGCSNYIIIGLHKYSSVEYMKQIENLMIKEFGARFINLREYLSTNAIEDANLKPTKEDIIAMQNGECPPQLLSSDGIHFNSISSSLIGNLVYDRLLNLGIVE